MIRYQYTTANNKFISKHKYNIDQPSPRVRNDELKSILRDNLNSKDVLLNYYLKNILLKNSNFSKKINIIPFLVNLINS